MMRAKTINPAKEHIQFVETTKDGAISLEPAEKSFDFISPGAGDRIARVSYDWDWVALQAGSLIGAPVGGFDRLHRRYP